MEKVLNDSFKYITQTYRGLHKAASQGKSVAPAAEWLLDNYYIIEQDAKDIRDQVKGRTARGLRRGASGVLILGWAEHLVREYNFRIDAKAICEFLKTEQKNEPLATDELWMFPAAVKVALIREIARICRSMKPDNDRETQNRIKTEMGNAITALISTRDIEWKDEFEDLSHIDMILSKDPANVYQLMDFESKTTYRHAISQIAKKLRTSEDRVAQCAYDCAVRGSEGKRAHVGYYLIDSGKRELLVELGLRGRATINRTALYIVPIASLAVIGAIFTGYLTKSAFGAVLAFVPLLDIFVTLANRIATGLTEPRRLPRLKLEDGIPDEGKTVIVFPVLLASAKAAEEMAKKLEVCHIANKDENLSYIILGDFKDAQSETLDDDKEIMEACENEVNKLNVKYGNRFYFFNRKRKYNEMQKKWMVWERKRGALIELNRFLRGENRFDHIVGDVSRLENVKYVITLDSDTFLPIGAAKKLVGAMLHPLNKAEICKEKKIVTEGYGIVQPRVSVDLASANKTLFTRVFAGQGGIDPYSTTISDVYMDVFGEAVFTGKGIYDVDVFTECIDGAFPDNSVLSHDLLEGSYARCALDSTVEVYDSYPHSFASYVKRMHRWIRGDWQLMPWLFPKVKNAAKKTVKNPLSALSKWKITDNLRRSLSPVAQVLLIIGAGSVFAGGEIVWVSLAVLALALPMILYLIDSLFSKSFFYIGEKRNSTIIYGVRSWLYQFTLSIAFLAYTAYVSADAILRTIIRVTVTRKNTLEWVTAADAERKLPESIMGYYAFMAASVAASAALITVSLAAAQEYLGVAFVFAIIWAGAPLVAFFISQSVTEDAYKLSDRDRKILTDIACRTWRFFDDFMTEEDNFLPPDNVQLHPYKGVAHRTSPTNIGLGILALLSARDLGFICSVEMADRIEKTLSTVECLQKWKGHLYNWYDTRTLRPLYPRYVSSVDSGNLLCYLMVAAKGIMEYEKEIGPKAGDLFERIMKIVSETSFLPLYDEKKQFFSVGFNIEGNRLTNSYYDLLASEARQTGFLSIARGEIEPKHWFRMGRSLTASDGYKGLVSWTGTMFEYLMPLLIMKSYKNTLLDETYYFAVRSHKKYGRRRKVPWGVSESGFYKFDINLNYQYKAFGVPELGLKRGLAEDVVVAPYATMLALMVDTKSALYNLAALKRHGALGEYGYYEAVDYTPARIRQDQGRSVIKSYMSHHQGMGLVAITNVLRENIMQKRFHSWPEVRAAEPLLQERVPVKVPLTKEHKEHVSVVKIKWQPTVSCVRQYSGTGGTLPAMHILSNGTYTLIIDQRGNGVSSFDDIRLNRFRPDPTEEGRGHMVFIKNPASGRVWSAYKDKVVFSPHMAEFTGEEGGIESNLKICVSSEDSAEIRRLTLINRTGRRKVLEVTSYLEVSLNTYEAESSHAAFSNLFVKTDIKDGVMYAERRPRESSDKPYTAYCTAIAEGETEGDFQLETDRARFLGRGRTIKNAKAFEGAEILSATSGSVLDPCFAIRARLIIENGESASVTFISGIAETRTKAERTARRYKSSDTGAQFFEEAYRRAMTEGQYLELKENEETAFLHALPYLIYGGYPMKESVECIKENKSPFTEIWKMGISGDLPIVTLRMSEEADEAVLSELLRAHEYWRLKGITTDLAIICDEPAGYNSPLLELAREKIAASHARDLQGERGGVFVFGGQDLAHEDRVILMALSKLFIDASKGGLAQVPPYPQRIEKPEVLRAPQEDKTYDLNLLYFNSYGGFDKEKNEYVIIQRKNGDTPAPWVNVIANEKFGFLAGESGSGCTWSKNSRENRLTMWHNDPISDPPTEILKIEENGEEWSPMAAVFFEEGMYYTHHGLGYTRYVRGTRDLEHEALIFAPVSDSIKLLRLRLRNNADRDRKIKASYTLSPVMGNSIYAQRGKLRAAFAAQDVITVQNAFTQTGEMMFLASGNGGKCSVLDRGANTVREDTAGFDIAVSVEEEVLVPASGSAEAWFFLGAGMTNEECVQLVQKYRDRKTAEAGFSGMCEYWRDITGVIRVKTPSEATDTLLNSWLIYQALSCRIMGRTAFYQSGGAYGFRDQLQDVLALLYAKPEIARKQILLHAARQFKEGDVLHWWHESEHEGGPDRGVRTRFSDDRLWLCFTVADYINITGDHSILDEQARYLCGEPLAEDEHERYSVVHSLCETGSIYDHCIRAIDVSLTMGAHSLPVMGGGDWNDGMNNIGKNGYGESVWLAWFIKSILDKFAPICEERGDIEKARHYRREALTLCEAAESEAWDGNWYKRAFFDDGTPLGSCQNSECAIDSISQSWAVISEGAKKSRAKTAMQSVYDMLYDKTHGLIKLLTPPFDIGPQDPGYIKSYLPGVRENGGQYTHAAIWTAVAFAMMGDGDRACELFEVLNPINHSKTPILANVYKVEPYVMAADVYSVAPHEGRGGWTWYTGAAAWMYRLGIEYILGFKKEGDTLRIEPAICRDWNEFTIEYKYFNTLYVINVKRTGQKNNNEFKLANDGQRHEIEITF